MSIYNHIIIFFKYEIISYPPKVLPGVRDRHGVLRVYVPDQGPEPGALGYAVGAPDTVDSATIALVVRPGGPEAQVPRQRGLSSIRLIGARRRVRGYVIDLLLELFLPELIVIPTVGLHFLLQA